MRISPGLDADLNHIEAILPRAGLIVNPLSPATQSDILGILQREQDRAIALLSSSPLLAGLFVSYANKAAALATPSPESEEWKGLRNTIVTSREKIEKLKSENLKVTEGLEDDIKSLRAELTEAREKYDRLMVDSSAEKAAFLIQVLDLEAQQGKLKEAIAEQQTKISKPGRQGSPDSPNPSTAVIPSKAACTRETDTLEGLNIVEFEPSILSTIDRKEAAEQREKEREGRDQLEWEEHEERKRQEKADQEARRKECEERKEREHEEQEERTEKERIEREAREKAEHEAKEQAEREAREQAEKVARERTDRKRVEKGAARKAQQEAKEREARERAEEEARVKAERDAKRKVAKEAREQAVREAREKADQVAREKVERKVKKKEERKERKRLEREKEKIEREELEREAKENANRDSAGEREEEKKPSTSKTPSTQGPTASKNDRSSKTESGPLQKKQKNEWTGARDFGSTEEDKFPDRPPIITSSVPGGIFNDTGNLGDIPPAGRNDLPCSAEVEPRTPLTKRSRKGTDNLSNLSKVATLTQPADVGRLNILGDLNVNTSAGVSISVSAENVRFTDAEQGPHPTEPKGIEGIPTTQKPWPAPSLTPAPAPARTEPEKPLSLWEHKKPKATTQPAPSSSLFGGDNVMNSSGVWGGTDAARNQKRERQRESLVEGFLGSNPARGNGLIQSQMRTKPVTEPAPAPAAPPQKPGGWGSWGSSLLNNLTNVIAVEKPPSPSPPPVKPKIEDPLRGVVPNQPPRSQAAGFGSLNNPSRGTGKAEDDNSWGIVKTDPTPVSQKIPTGPTWVAKPICSTFGSGGTTWGSGTGSTFGSGVGKNLTASTAMKPPECSPGTAGPENTPKSAVGVKRVTAPGRSNSSVTDRKYPKVPSPVKKELVKMEETVISAEEDEFDWVPTRGGRRRKKKKGHAVSIFRTPSDPNNVDGGADGGKKKRKKRRR